MRHAVRLWLDGSTVTGAAKGAGLSREHLSRSLRKPHIATHVARVLQRRERSRAALLEIIKGLREGYITVDADGDFVDT
jgi:hypothetical protein